jgi:hypothetical protein
MEAFFLPREWRGYPIPKRNASYGSDRRDDRNLETSVAGLIAKSPSAHRRAVAVVQLLFDRKD